MNPLRIPGFIVRGVAEVVAENLIAVGDLIQSVLTATRPARR